MEYRTEGNKIKVGAGDNKTRLNMTEFTFVESGYLNVKKEAKL
jgi:hypothetical protein